MSRVHYNLPVVLLLMSLGMEADSTASQSYLHSVTIGGCLGQTVIYECSVVGEGYTVWAGSAFICQGSEITLQHTRFLDNTAVGECNNGGIIGRGMRVEGNVYTSYLNVTLTPEVIGKTVNCSFDDGSGNTPVAVGQLTLMVSNKPFSAPAVSTSIKADRITFTWNLTSLDYQALTFNITTTVNCGTCTTDTASSSTTCINFVTSRNDSVCQFMIQSVICGNITGNTNTTAKLINLKLPDIPVLQTLPYYLDHPQNILTKLFTTYNLPHPVLISDDINGSAINYTITYSDSISGSIYSSVSIPASSCFNGQCNHTFDALTSLCPPSTGINVSVFATNVFGDGPTTVPLTNDVNNNFVEVNFDHKTSSFQCTFLNQPQDYVKRCSVSIAHGVSCYQLHGIYSSSGIGDSIQTPSLMLNLTDGINKFCFSVNASSSGNRTVIVEGTLNIANNYIELSGINLPAAVSIPIVVMSIVIVTALILGIILRNAYRTHPPIETYIYTIKFSVKDEVGKLAKALKVFKKHGVNILGVNTHLHHPSFDRDTEDGCRENYMYCVCSRDKLEELKKEKELKNVEHVYDDSVPDTYPRTIKFQVKHEPGALSEALSKISSEKYGINIIGLNTRSNRKSATPGYKDNYVKCKCSEKIKKGICEDLERAGARNITIIDHQEQKTSTPRNYALVVRDRVGSIAGALQVFSECGINIDGVNLRHIPRVNRNAKTGYRSNYVECQCAQPQIEELCKKLLEMGAEGVKRLSEDDIRRITDNHQDYSFRSENDFCVIEFSILNEAGALARALNAFATQRINIIGVNTLFYEPPTNAQLGQQDCRVTYPTHFYNCVKYQSISNETSRELKQRLTDAGFELDAEQDSGHSTESDMLTFWFTDQTRALKTTMQVFTELDIKIIHYTFDSSNERRNIKCKQSYVEFHCTDKQEKRLKAELGASRFVVHFQVSDDDERT